MFVFPGLAILESSYPNSVTVDTLLGSFNVFTVRRLSMRDINEQRASNMWRVFGGDIKIGKMGWQPSMVRASTDHQIIPIIGGNESLRFMVSDRY
jgi:hypothetical protein